MGMIPTLVQPLPTRMRLTKPRRRTDREEHVQPTCYCPQPIRGQPRRDANRPPNDANPVKEWFMRSKRLTQQQKKEIFLDLVKSQDEGLNVRKSYQMLTERFAITEAQLRQIEDEGLDKQWPPLNEAVQVAGEK